MSIAPLTNTQTGRASQWNATDGAAHVIGKSLSNMSAKFRDTFSVWPSDTWNASTASGDIIALDGNALGASYLVISSDPLSAGAESYIDTKATFAIPTELAVGVHASQAVWGRDLSIEYIDVEFLDDVPDLEILSISQTTTTMTVETVLPHGMGVGRRIGIRGCSDSRANYPSVVVASITSPTIFTITGGPNSTLPSLTINNPAGDKGFIYQRPALSGSRNGTALHFESATATLGFFSTRASAGDVLPFASGSGNALTARQAITVGTTASIALATAPYTYMWTPTTEYRLTVFADKVQWTDSAVDAITTSTNRMTRTQVVPNPAKNYFLRFKVRTEPSTTIPIGQIISASKAGSTTATVVMDRPHNLVTGDLVVGYGVRAQGTGFYPALTTPASVTVVDDTTFTVVWGTSATNTEYGGFISKVNGGCPQPGAISQSIQSVTKTTLADGQHQLVVVGNTTWAGAAIGDYVNIVGCRDAVDGTTSLGVDGPWKVANLATSTLTLVNLDTYSPTVADFATTDCGGGVIRRTDMRISYVRLLDFERLRVELLPRPTTDLASAIPVNGNVVVTTLPTLATVTTAGTPAVPATPYFVNSAASTNGALILTGTSGMPTLWASNSGATAAFIKLYNKATAPVVGTDVPEMIIPVPAESGGVPGTVRIASGFQSFRFPLGLGIAITGGAADNDTTAVAAGQVKVKLSRTV
jgi:hypothetical protein